MKIKPEQKAEYEKWVSEIVALATKRGFEWLIPPDPDFEDMYLDGLSPAEALDEEIDAAQQCT